MKKKSMDKYFAESKAEFRGGLLDLVPSETERRNSDSGGWIPLSRAPKSAEIDDSKTSDDLIIEGKAVLKDGRKVFWG